jgi:ABC-type ATPase with predicted acetyltransferase domain
MSSVNGVFKTKVYQTSPHMEELREIIHVEVYHILRELQLVSQNLCRRCGESISANGEHFQCLL